MRSCFDLEILAQSAWVQHNNNHNLIKTFSRMNYYLWIAYMNGMNMHIPIKKKNSLIFSTSVIYRWRKSIVTPHNYHSKLNKNVSFDKKKHRFHFQGNPFLGKSQTKSIHENEKKKKCVECHFWCKCERSVCVHAKKVRYNWFIRIIKKEITSSSLLFIIIEQMMRNFKND